MHSGVDIRSVSARYTYSMDTSPPMPTLPPTSEDRDVRRAKWLLGVGAVSLVLSAGFIIYRAQQEGIGISPTPTSSTSAQTVLKYMEHWSDYQTDGIFFDGKLQSKGLKQYLDEYEQLHPNIKFQLVYSQYDKYAAQLQLLHDADAAPDIYQIYSTWGVSFAHNGVLDTPPADIQRDVQEHYVSTAGVTIDGKIWGIPTEINDVVLLYNKKLFREAGLTDTRGDVVPPTTWSQLVDAAVTLTQRDAQHNITQYGYAFLPDIDAFVIDPYLSLVYSNGGTFLSPDYKQCMLTEPAAVEALEAIVSLFKRGATDSTGNVWDFGKGKVAMVILPPWVENTLREAMGASFDEVVGVAPVPMMKRQASSQYSWFMGVTQKSKQKQAAWDFLRWFALEKQPAMGTTRYGDLMAQTIGAIPSRTDDIEGHEKYLGGSSFRRVFVEQLEHSVPEPNVAESAAIKTILMKQIQAAWTSRITPKAALQGACKDINAILVQNY